MPEEDERLVEGGILVVGTRPASRTIAIGAEDVVVDQEMAVAEPLGGLSKIANRGGIGTDLELRKDDSEVHL